mmetsp:Transcript_97832/g.187654  ORF Transcript_97832/g.187654 Transcript_97832/m.187654 type:complete len:163 (+) Transcript_97832:2580-3068(+)
MNAALMTKLADISERTAAKQQPFLGEIATTRHPVPAERMRWNQTVPAAKPANTSVRPTRNGTVKMGNHRLQFTGLSREDIKSSSGYAPSKSRNAPALSLCAPGAWQQQNRQARRLQGFVGSKSSPLTAALHPADRGSTLRATKPAKILASAPRPQSLHKLEL